MDVALYIRDEGGYELILRALQHYRLRLRTISKSPELESAAMFVQILQQESMKTIPSIDVLLKTIPLFLHDPSLHINKIIDDIPLIKKALDSYCSGIRKALDSKSEYYVKLLGNLATNEELENAINTSYRLVIK
ncbi:MAG: hypothetical protein K8823_1115 [Cenarchaeum symbiont of Oopsacas minuta]|nr:hypothetical protein [Cenarchaeum symbiont of Oopsacas minuta]